MRTSIAVGLNGAWVVTVHSALELEMQSSVTKMPAVYACVTHLLVL